MTTRQSPSVGRGRHGVLARAWGGLLALLLLQAAGASAAGVGRVWAQAEEPTVERPGPPATAVPFYPPTPLPKDEPEEDEDEDEPVQRSEPAASPTPQPPGFVLPARTQRPTRTPRATALPSATPLAAGGLRLTFSAAPAELLLREPAVFTLDLVNQGDQEVSGLVLDVVVPDVLIDYQVQPRSGEVSRAGGLLSWHLSRFGPGERSSLRLAGRVARAGGERTGICALLVSSGSAVEHCASYPVLSVRPEAAAAGSPPPDAPEDLDAQEAPSGADALLQAGRPGLQVGFALLLAGVALLGAWWARSRLAGREAPDLSDEPPPSAEASGGGSSASATVRQEAGTDAAPARNPAPKLAAGRGRSPASGSHPGSRGRGVPSKKG